MRIYKEFEAFLLESKPKILGFHPHFENAFWEMLINGGKRFRPNLVLTITESLNPLVSKNAFLPALAIECLHTYSLIHDDLPCMDNSPLRRGNPTLHTTYDETTAVLVGDGLNTFAFYLMSESILDSSVKVACIKELAFNGGIGGMIIGQAMDCFFENQKLDLEQLKTIHINKTAKLIAASLKIGAMIGESKIDSSLTNALYDFGLDLGLFFQIRDDVIDCVLDSSQAGKQTNIDTNKNSYVNLLGLDSAKIALKESKLKLESSLNSFPKTIKNNLTLLLEDYFKEL